jgi:hypothetical protein
MAIETSPKPERCSWKWGPHASRVLFSASRRKHRTHHPGEPFGSTKRRDEICGVIPAKPDASF